jgi:DNA-binding XRE family transcriptional regulator
MFQKDLAKVLGVDRISVQNWERNIYKPHADILPKVLGWLADGLGE